MGFTAVLARLPAIVDADPPDGGRGRRGRSGPPRHHRQPGFHPPGREARAPPRAATSRSSITSARRSGPGGPGAARKMRAYVDHLLALLPFEPEAHRTPRRPADDLCRPSPDRAARRDPARARASAVRSGEGAGRARRSARQPPLRGGPADGAVRRRARALVQAKALAAAAVTDPGRRASRGRDRRARRELAGPSRSCVRRGREMGRLPRRACGARGLRHGDPGARPVGRPDGRRLPGLEARGDPEIPHQGAARSCSPTWCSARTSIPELIQWDCTPEKLAEALLPLLSETPERRRSGGRLRAGSTR